MDRRHLMRLALAAAGTAQAARTGRAQPSAPKRIGLLLNGGPGPFHDAWRRAFAQDFSSLGLIEGRDFAVEPLFAQGQLGRLPDLAAEHVRRGVDVIVALGGPAAAAAQRATPTIPIVFAIVTDPVALGLVETIQRPGRNLTGVTSLDPGQAAAQIGLLKDVLPGLERVALLSDATIPGADPAGHAPIDRANLAAAQAQGLRAQLVKVPGPTAAAAAPDFDAALAAMGQERAQAVLVFDTPLNFAHGARIGALALAQRLPAMFAGGMSAAGGLITYGTSVLESHRMLPAILARILRGTSPAEIPVEFLTRRELVFNLGVAERIGVAVPAALLARADRVIR